MELLTVKIIALTVLGVLSLFFGLLPLRLRRALGKGNSRRRERIVSCLLCFGGGVLLATVFTHMLPETREGFSRAAAQGSLTVGVHYPLAEVVICAGFFLIYFVEEFVHKIFLKHDSHNAKKLTKLAAAIEEESTPSNHLHHHHHHHNNNNNNNNHSHNNYNSHHTSAPTTTTTTRADEAEDENQNSNRCSVYTVGEDTATVLPPKSQWARSGVDNPVFAGDLDATAWNPSLRASIMSTSSQESTCPPQRAPSTRVAPQQVVGHQVGKQDSGHGHSHLAMTRLDSKNIASNLRSLLVILALSFHSVFEGLAVGLQEREVDVWYLLGAISAHKFVIAFCMGLELLVSGTSAGLMVIYMVVFALVSPLGVAFGILVTENLASHTGGHLLLVTVLQGLAGGTILYVTFFEVLERERSRAGGRLLKLLFVLLGFSAMASLEAFGGHSHGPSEGQGHSHSHGPVKLPLTTTMASTSVDPHDHDDDDHHHHDHHHHGHSH